MAVDGLRDCLESHGHTVIPFYRSSAELRRSKSGKAAAFFSGIYSSSARSEFACLLDEERPDLVHINNLFPLISPSILAETKSRGVPAVMTVHNYRLLCPTGLLFSHGELCHRCAGGREWWCAIRNCTGEWPKSAGYAMRNAVARLRGSFVKGIDRFIAPTIFVKSMLAWYGYPADRIDVVRLIVSLENLHSQTGDGTYVAYLGRISPKRRGNNSRGGPAVPRHTVRFAGHYLQMPDLPAKAPPNCEFMGEVAGSSVSEFLCASRFTIFSSRWYEVSPLSLVDAILQAKAVICARLGGLPEFVDDGSTGLLFTAGDSHDLAKKICYLWERPELCRKMGQAGRAKVLAMFSPSANYNRLLDVYQSVLN